MPPQGATEVGTYKVIILLNEVTATAESLSAMIAGAKKVTLLFTRSAHAAGSSLFTVTTSLDGTTFGPFNKLISNVANTNVQDLTRVASVSLAANGSERVSLDLQHDAFHSMRVAVTETTDGTHTCQALIEF